MASIFFKLPIRAIPRGDTDLLRYWASSIGGAWGICVFNKEE
jgi:hypothetical protein